MNRDDMENTIYDLEEQVSELQSQIESMQDRNEINIPLSVVDGVDEEKKDFINFDAKLIPSINDHTVYKRMNISKDVRGLYKVYRRYKTNKTKKTKKTEVKKHNFTVIEGSKY